MDRDVVVVGAGFGGINALHVLREQGLDAVLLERADGVGGTWYWNRYPGARVDIESMEYSYGFSDELQQEWSWSERYAGQPEVRRYLDWVTDRLGLRDHMRFSTPVTGASWSESARRWRVRAGDSETYEARFLVLATGFLSAPVLPDIPGLPGFGGDLVHTAAWPADGVELAGRRVGVIGTAASGVQVIQEIASVVERLTVFQRTANWCFPLRNRPMDPGYEAFVKANYPEIRRLARETPGPGAVLMDGRIVPTDRRSALEATSAERVAAFEWRWNAGGVHMGRSFGDLITSEAANDELRRFLEPKIRSLVHDQETAARLIPDHRPLTRRPPGESGYYEAFNRDNVELVDLREEPIGSVGPSGVRLAGGREIGLDVLVCATGFDSGTGAVLRIDVRGRDGVGLGEHWADGARVHLGIMTTRFPNLFLVNGPQSPAVHFSPPVLADFQSRHIGALIGRLGPSGVVEPREDAQDEWVAHLGALYDKTLIPKTDSWWTAANVPGKPRQVLNYAGSFASYARRAGRALDGLAAYVVR
jgi:cyclohexanone monooxygenase